MLFVLTTMHDGRDAAHAMGPAQLEIIRLQAEITRLRRLAGGCLAARDSAIATGRETLSPPSANAQPTLVRDRHQRDRIPAGLVPPASGRLRTKGPPVLSHEHRTHVTVGELSPDGVAAAATSTTAVAAAATAAAPAPAAAVAAAAPPTTTIADAAAHSKAAVLVDTSIAPVAAASAPIVSPIVSSSSSSSSSSFPHPPQPLSPSPPLPFRPPWSPSGAGGGDTMAHFCWMHQDYGLVEQWAAETPTHHCPHPPSVGGTSFDCKPPPRPQSTRLPQMPTLCEARNLGFQGGQLLHTPGCNLNHPVLSGLATREAGSLAMGTGTTIVDTPVYVIEEERVRTSSAGHFNLFHKMDDILNAFLAVRAAGIVSPRREGLQVLVIGGGGGGRMPDEANPLVVMIRRALSASQHIETFGSVASSGLGAAGRVPNKPLGATSRMLYRRVILHAHWPGSMGLVWRGSACHHSAFFRDFGQLVLGGMGLLQLVPAPSHPVVLFLVRRRTPHRNVGRVFANEDEIFRMLSTAGTGVSAVRVDMSRLPFSEQVEVARHSNVLVGAHGAGLTHALFLADEAVVVEILPPYRRDQHFRNIVRLAGKVYMPYHADRVDCVAKSSNIHVNVAHLRGVVDAAVRIARSFSGAAASKVYCGLDPQCLAKLEVPDPVHPCRGNGAAMPPNAPGMGGTPDTDPAVAIAAARATATEQGNALHKVLKGASIMPRPGQAGAGGTASFAEAKELGSRLQLGGSMAVGLGRRGASCDDFCASLAGAPPGARCDAAQLSRLNNCASMRAVAGGHCAACRMSQGEDQPGVALDIHHDQFVAASMANRDNVCMLRSAGPPTCGGSHETMSRGCACSFGRR